MEGSTLHMCVIFSHSQTFIVISQKGDPDGALSALCGVLSVAAWVDRCGRSRVYGL